MSWKPKITDGMANVLRFLITGAILLDAIIFSVSSIYFVAKFAFRLIQYLDRIMLSKPW